MGLGLIIYGKRRKKLTEENYEKKGISEKRSQCHIKATETIILRYIVTKLLSKLLKIKP
jgi:hypothetical protein